MDKKKVIEQILLEYSHLSENGGASFNNNVSDHDLLFTAIERAGYADCFSFVKLSEVLESQSKSTGLSDDDIKKVRSIMGPLRNNFSDEDLRNVKLNDPVYSPAAKFPGAESHPDGISYSEMVKYVKNEISKNQNLIITQSPSRLRIRTHNGIQISKINVPTGLKIGSPYFKGLMLYLKLYKEFPNAITIVEKEQAGIEQEKTSVNELNVYFEKNNPTKTSFKLYVQDGSNVIDTSVLVDSAQRLQSASTNKADIILSNKNTPTFWISFKDADYFEKAGSTKLAKVGFQQYGSIKSLSGMLKKDSVWKSIEEKMLNGLLKYQRPYDIVPRTTTIDDKTGYVTVINGKPVAKILSPDKIVVLQQFSKAFERAISDESTDRKVIYFCDEGFTGKLDFIDGSLETKEIAGKAIYGLNFKIDGSAPFGDQNCNLLMQSGTPLTIEQHNTGETPSVILKTDEKGHVLFNPNLPLPKNMGDPILIYRPVLQARYTKNEFTVFKVNNTTHLFFGMRILIIPAGKVAPDSMDLSR